MHRIARTTFMRWTAIATLAAAGTPGCETAPHERAESAAPRPGVAPLASSAVRLDAGPVLGSVTQTGARIWVHVADLAGDAAPPVALRLVLEDPTVTSVRAFEATADLESGGAAIFRVEGLRPGSNMAYRIVAPGSNAVLATGRIRTQPTRAPETRLAFGSCADIDASTARTWKAINAEHPDALVLLGDTPYVDTTALGTQRERYLQFAQPADFASLVAETPLYSVWDDHDFGANNTDGRLAGKTNSRRAFMENRPNPTFGEGAAGIYTSFRQGEVEVFLLDTRWFAGTEQSRQDPTKPTLLGESQWRWLEQGLSRSKATFRIVACGMVWNGLVTADKTDCWGRYPHEFERFVRLVGSTKASGVVLVSGDVHRSRVVRHATASLIGYDLTEFVTSPLHGRIIAEADVREPKEAGDAGAKGAGIAATVVFDRGEPNAFLLVDTESAAPGTGAITARFVNADGTRFHTVRLPLESLKRAR